MNENPSLDNEFIPLILGVSDKFKNLYLINRYGKIKREKDGLIFSITKGTHKGGDGYPRVFLTAEDNTREAYLVHRLVALHFVPNDNPETKIIVDHIDRDKQNYFYSNLRWVTSSENQKNRVFSKKETDRLIFLRVNPNNNNIIEVLRNKDLYSGQRQPIYESIKEHKTYLGVLWDVIDLRLEQFYNKFGLPKVWKRITKFEEREVYCSDNGFIKFKNSGGNFEYTPGHKNTAGYMIFNYGKLGYRVHRLVYEVFRRNGKELPLEIEIDHIDTNPENNSIENLRECSTHKENLNNPLTLENMGKQVHMFSIKGKYLRTFKSITDAYVFLGCSTKSSRISYICSGKSNSLVYKSYLWSYNSSEDLISEEMKTRLIFQYDKNRELINVYNIHRCLREIKDWNTKNGFSFDEISLKNSIQSGKLCSDGLYYSKGPMI